jgi:uncharacterized protein (TIGR03067 family)
VRTRMIGMTSLGVILLTAGAFAGAPAEDKKSIQGTWTIVYGFFEGKRMPAEEIKNVELVIGAEKIVGRQKGKDEGNDNEWSFKLDPSKKPKTIDLVIKSFKVKPGGQAVELVTQKMIGIYELKDNELRIALSKGIPLKKDPKEQLEAEKSVARPKSFEHSPDLDGVLFLKRTTK